jgi:uncharacterized protein (DUF1778 family)
MPTKNPRINITVKPERYELLKRLASHQGTTMSGLVSETMEMMYPVMERVCVVLEAAKMAQESSKDGLRKTIAKAEAELLPMLYEAVGQFDMFVDDAAKSVGVEHDASSHAVNIIRDIMDKDAALGASGTGSTDARLARAGGRGAEATGNPRHVIRGSGFPTEAKSVSTRRPKK